MSKHYVSLDTTQIKLKIVNESTIVDEKNHRVIHTVNWVLVIPHLMYDLFYELANFDIYGKISGKAKGIAICHSEDKFNPETGKKMARAIAESNAYHNASRIISKRLRRLNYVVHQMSVMGADFALKTRDIAIHNKEYQDSLINK